MVITVFYVGTTFRTETPEREHEHKYILDRDEADHFVRYCMGIAGCQSIVLKSLVVELTPHTFVSAINRKGWATSATYLQEWHRDPLEWVRS